MSDENYYKVGGSLEYQHPTYVVRKADADLYDGLKNGEFCYVLNSRQMGKSSLRVQMMKKLKEQGVKCASIDMTRIGSHVAPAEWYAGVVSELLRGFGLARKIHFSDWWRAREMLPPLQRLSELIEDVLLVEFSENIVIFVDEIDSIIKINFKEDFFAFIRACYNQRVDNSDYNRLTFCLLGVATPSDLITDKNISTPFNIGRAIELTGFQLHEVQPLIQGLAGRVSRPEIVIREVLEWTGGQPFLTQKLCKQILNWEKSILEGREAECVEGLVRGAVAQLALTHIIENWETQDEPEHLRTIRDRILWSPRKEQLLRLYQHILETGEVRANDTPEHMELRLSGLVVKEQGKLRVYNRLYASVFNHSWVESALVEVGFLPKVAETPVPFRAEIQALELAALDAIQQFKSQQIEALVSAMQAGQSLKTLLREGGSLQDYPAISPLYALQTILYNIRERNQFKCHQGRLYDVCFSPDGQCLATVGEDDSVRLCNLFGQHLARWQAYQGKIDDVCFSPNGQLIATAGADGTARVWNLLGQQLVQFNGHRSWMNSVTFSPNGQLIATAGADGTARVWNLSGQQLVQFNGHQCLVWSVSFSPDGQRIATAGDDGTARLWDLSGQQLVQFQGHQGQVWSVSFSPDGQKIATAGADATARVWNLFGQQIAQLNGHQDCVRLVIFSLDGQYLATAGYDGTARLWNLSGQQLTQLNGHASAVLGMSFSPDDQGLVTASLDGTTRVWDLSEKHSAQLSGHRGKVWSVSFSPDGQLIATAGGDGTARLWNLSGQQIAQLDGHQGSVWSVSFSPDGQYLVTIGSDSTARLWNLAGQQLARLHGHKGWVTRVAFSPDGQRLATVGREGTARLWDLSGELIRQVTPHQGWVWSVSFSSNGQLVATVGLDATPALLDSSGKLIIQLKDYQDAIANSSFSPDGQYLATVSSEDGTARLWNVFGQQLALLDGHQDWFICVSFSPDGQLIATAGEDSSVCLWDLSGRQVSLFNNNQGAVYCISFSPDGKFLATAGKNGTVKLWRIKGLDELLKRGCDWLKDYFVTHPKALEKLGVCQDQISSVEAGKPLAEIDQIEGKIITTPTDECMLSTEDEDEFMWFSRDPEEFI
jgi:WD40 repeat protein